MTLALSHKKGDPHYGSRFIDAPRRVPQSVPLTRQAFIAQPSGSLRKRRRPAAITDAGAPQPTDTPLPRCIIVRSRSSSSQFFKATGVPLNLLLRSDKPSVFSLFLHSFGAHDHRLFDGYLKRRAHSMEQGTCDERHPAPPVAGFIRPHSTVQRLFLAANVLSYAL